MRKTRLAGRAFPIQSNYVKYTKVRLTQMHVSGIFDSPWMVRHGRLLHRARVLTAFRPAFCPVMEEWPDEDKYGGSGLDETESRMTARGGAWALGGFRTAKNRTSGAR